MESVGRNGVKRVVDALLRLTTTDRAVERIVTIHTKLFARYQDRMPAFKFLQTFIVDEIKGIAEAARVQSRTIPGNRGNPRKSLHCSN